MTTPPLPASPCVRVRLDYTATDSTEAGSRFYLSYAGAAPTGGNCATLASDIAAAWATHIAPLVSDVFALTEVDVLDISSLTGLSGNWTGTNAGTASGTALPSQVATNVEFDIARRYRGGKPRMFLPATVSASQVDGAHWSSTFITAVNTGVAAFYAEIEALTIGAVGTLAHVNLSYYQGFKNITNSSGRERAVPQYRAAALLDSIEGYACKAVMSTQKKRRTATTY
jgi:hypothetical protein